jgi:ADP-heptose:LPS heptosyltransferase
MIKIAILNLEDITQLQYTINCLEKIHQEIIGVKIDMFIDKQNLEFIHDNKFIENIIPLDLNNINIFNFKNKYDIVNYYNKNKYHIAVDTQGTLKSAFFNYQLTGKTAGFLYPSLKGKIISNFYDEKVELKSIIEKEEKTKILLSHTFGFEV